MMKPYLTTCENSLIFPPFMNACGWIDLSRFAFHGWRHATEFGADCCEINQCSGKFYRYISRFWSQLSLLKLRIVELPQNSAPIRTAFTDTGMFNLVYVLLIDNFNRQRHILSILKSEVLSWAHAYFSCAFWMLHLYFAISTTSKSTYCWFTVLMRAFSSQDEWPSGNP